jgi:hypothetical protein
VQHQEVRARTRHQRVRATFIVTEFDEQGLVIEFFDDRANLPTCKSLRAEGRQ